VVISPETARSIFPDNHKLRLHSLVEQTLGPIQKVGIMRGKLGLITINTWGNPEETQEISIALPITRLVKDITEPTDQQNAILDYYSRIETLPDLLRPPLSTKERLLLVSFGKEMYASVNRLIVKNGGYHYIDPSNNPFDVSRRFAVDHNILARTIGNS
jgi:hypothetical protein